MGTVVVVLAAWFAVGMLGVLCLTLGASFGRRNAWEEARAHGYALGYEAGFSAGARASSQGAAAAAELSPAAADSPI